MPTILDCSNIDSTISSLETILHLNGQVIREFVSSFSCDAYSDAHPQDHRHLWDILPELLCDHGASTSNPDIVYWFHGTRVLDLDTIRNLGLKSLHEQIEQIWVDLFRLAQPWVSQETWQAFRLQVETTDPLDSSNRHRQRLSNAANGGPHAVLIRDAIAAPARFKGWDYLSAPETIADLCESFSARYGHNLLDKFRSQSIPCIVKFQDRCRRDDLVGVAISYLWCSLHEETCAPCNACFDGDRDAVPATVIVGIDELPNSR